MPSPFAARPGRSYIPIAVVNFGQESSYTMSNNGLQGSMDRVGACGDNAAMEPHTAGPGLPRHREFLGCPQKARGSAITRPERLLVMNNTTPPARIGRGRQWSVNPRSTPHFTTLSLNIVKSTSSKCDPGHRTPRHPPVGTFPSVGELTTKIQDSTTSGTHEPSRSSGRKSPSKSSGHPTSKNFKEHRTRASQ